MKRLGMVLLGMTEPSVREVIDRARAIRYAANNIAEAPLHKLYDGVVEEPLPPDLGKLLQAAGGINGQGRHRAAGR